MGIATGDMPDVEFIWAVQRTEDSDVCFGQGNGCTRRNCRWRARCVALDFFADYTLPMAAVPAQSNDKIPLLIQNDTIPKSKDCDFMKKPDPFVESGSPAAGTKELAVVKSDNANTCTKAV